MNGFPHLFTMQAIAIILAFLVAITFHEFSHALTATMLGDPTAKRLGRLTLNPFAHLDLIGLLFLFVFGIGWAKPVPFNLLYFKRPRLYAVLTAFAGPISNFVLALGCLLVLRIFTVEPFMLARYTSQTITETFVYIFKAIIDINIMLGVFNLLPLPPLDGSHLIFALIPTRWHRTWFAIQRYMIFVLLILFSLPATRYFFWHAVRNVKLFLVGLVF